MSCVLQVRDLMNSSQILVTLIVIYNILIGALNISGNAILIWALRRTRQTKSLSFQFIMVMSCSDLITGITGLVIVPLIFNKQYLKHCWQKLATQFVLFACNYVSVFMLVLIALDRYFHMKYLDRYSTICSKKRGYYALITSVLLAISISSIGILQINRTFHQVLQAFYELMTSILLVSVILIYYAALHALRRNAHQLTGSIINRNRTLGRAAKRVSFCILALSSPIAIFVLLDNAGSFERLLDESVVNSCVWFAYTTFLGNGFCSSIIFISQNRPIKRLLRRVVRDNWNRIRPLAQTIEKAV